jgi:hypothetical protein
MWVEGSKYLSLSKCSNNKTIKTTHRQTFIKKHMEFQRNKNFSRRLIRDNH